ncbi:hypothetical protein F5Y04DRAFT_257174 [Hypomontagnella monticulosa]|nr:hypothetical protein F5Y04DRAFT_257174 [Hypomontagnella monticulosa]
MTAVTTFRARYTDETSLYEHLRKIFPIGNIQIRFQRGRFHCTTPEALSATEYDDIQSKLESEHYER